MSNFGCKKCGKCCSNFLPLSKEEIKELRKRAIKENKQLLDKNWYSICPFLNYKNECDIYENRPSICKNFDCYKFENNLVSDEMVEQLRKQEFELVDLRKEIFNSNEKNENI